jgi:carboxyl-terminal processing protease
MSSTTPVDDLTDPNRPESAPVPSPLKTADSSVPVEPVIAAPTRAERPATWLAATLLLVLVFTLGVLIGQSGALGGGPTGNASGATPGASASQPASNPPSGTDQPSGITTNCDTGVFTGGAPTEPAEAPADFDVFWQALACIRQEYVGRADLIDKDVTYGAIRGMVQALGDTGHSVFLTPEALASEQQSLSGSVEGIGALLGTKDGQPMIVSVIVGGPASTAGLKAGDFILTVNGEKVTDLDPGEVATKIRGPAGTQVVVEVLRPSTSEQLTFTMTRAKITFPPASWAFVPGTHIADLRLIQFSSGAANELRKARDEAAAQGATGFILDLRSNPGGFVPEAVNTASLFLSGKTVYIRELADGTRIPVGTCYPTDTPGRDQSICSPEQSGAPTDLPLVVLIDQGTASSSEIVSGAIQAAQRGQLVGETTFGTGTVLLTYHLTDGSAVRIAVERWLTPDGALIFAKGITPNVEVALPGNATALEPQQLAALTPEQVPTMDDTQMLKGIQILQAAGAQ